MSNAETRGKVSSAVRQQGSTAPPHHRLLLFLVGRRRRTVLACLAQSPKSPVFDSATYKPVGCLFLPAVADFLLLHCSPSLTTQAAHFHHNPSINSLSSDNSSLRYLDVASNPIQPSPIQPSPVQPSPRGPRHFTWAANQPAPGPFHPLSQSTDIKHLISLGNFGSHSPRGVTRLSQRKKPKLNFPSVINKNNPPYPKIDRPSGSPSASASSTTKTNNGARRASCRSRRARLYLWLRRTLPQWPLLQQ